MMRTLTIGVVLMLTLDAAISAQDALVVEPDGTISVGLGNGDTVSLQEFLVPVGTIEAYAGSVPPDGWLICDGSEIDAAIDPKFERLVELLRNEVNGDVDHPYYAPTPTAATLPNLTTHDTGWVPCDDWTNQHLGDTVNSNVTHGLGLPLRDLEVRVLISTDGTYANSFGVPLTHNMYQATSGIGYYFGGTVHQIDMDNIRIPTAGHGVRVYNQSGGDLLIDTESYHYRVIVSPRAVAGGATNYIIKY